MFSTTLATTCSGVSETTCASAKSTYDAAVTACNLSPLGSAVCISSAKTACDAAVNALSCTCATTACGAVVASAEKIGFYGIMTVLAMLTNFL